METKLVNGLQLALAARYSFHCFQAGCFEELSLLSKPSIVLKTGQIYIKKDDGKF